MLPPLPSSHACWPDVSRRLSELAQAPPASGASLALALAPLAVALGLSPLDVEHRDGLTAFFDEAPPSSCARRAAWLRGGGLAATLSCAARLSTALADSETFAAQELRLLPSGAAASTVYSRSLAASLLSCAFLCLTTSAGWDYPVFTFRGLWAAARFESSCQAKLDCHLAYLARAAKTPPHGLLLVERRVLPRIAELTAEELCSSALPLCPLLVFSQGALESSAAPVHADFANSLLGGGAFSSGNVQEEILFSVCPELCVGMLLAEEMQAREAIVLRGAGRFSSTSGYGRSLQFEGDFDDRALADERGVLRRCIVALDALAYRPRDAGQQFREKALLRELHKALAAFRSGEASSPSVATGNWGCGAFGGHVPLKAMLQWLAASLANCESLEYYTFGDPAAEGLQESAALLSACTVGQLGAGVISYCRLVCEQGLDAVPTLWTWLGRR